MSGSEVVMIRRFAIEIKGRDIIHAEVVVISVRRATKLRCPGADLPLIQYQLTIPANISFI
jgi:hypothetical protein